MMELLAKFSPGQLIGLVAVVGGLLCPITAIIARHWFMMRQLTLKQDMLSRGMSAEEIRQVLEAGSTSSRREVRRHHACHS
jgi:hypothetical protein